MSEDYVEQKIKELDARMGKIEENLAFIKDLLSHIHGQFQTFKRDADSKK